MQDTHFDSKLEPYVSAEWGYTCYFSSNNSSSRGVAVLFNNNFEFKIKKVRRGDNGNYIVISVQIQEANFLLVKVYGPNRDEPQFYHAIKNYLTKLEYTNIVVAGDFNLVVDPSRDYHNYKHVNTQRQEKQLKK